MYGPTETTIWSSATRVGAGPVRLGPPIANTQFYVLNEKLRPVPVGVTAELFIGGSGLARGYWHREDLTAEKFVQNPFGAGRIYRTGDLARWRPDGSIELLGRTDYQVKVRGYRIELGEVETALASHPAVRDAVVLAIDIGAGEKQLAAWVDSDVQPLPSDLSATLRALLATKVPEYMVPSTISVLSALTRTPNGKIDRKTLPSPMTSNTKASRAFTPAETPRQKKLAEIWADVLKLDKVSITDSIFELGADSLMIFRISARAKKEGLVIQPAQIFQMRTIADLACALDKDRAANLEPVALGSTILPVSREKFRRTRA
jgi:acyl carrier protein